jgi:NTE family protein
MRKNLLFVTLLAGCTELHFSNSQLPYADPIETENADIALVLGGGGAKGMAHVGVIEELYLEGINPDLIVGCSAGAIVGGMYAALPNIYQLKNYLMPMKRGDLLDVSMSSFPHGLSDTNSLVNVLNRYIGNTDFSSTKIRFATVATNLEFGKLTIFSKENLVEAIAASAAFPGAFTPVYIADQPFVDGGVIDPVPVAAARELGGKYVIAVQLETPLPTTRPQHLGGVLMRTLEIAHHNISTSKTQAADYIITIQFTDVSTFDDNANEKVYMMGRSAARKALPALCAKLKQKFKRKICKNY